MQTDEGCLIQGDARRIERVVMNLLSNAVKYSPRNTCVTVRVQKEDSQAVLTVSDQGPGIAEDDLGVLFQPFGRGRSADTLAEGTGVGLYVVSNSLRPTAARSTCRATRSRRHFPRPTATGHPIRFRLLFRPGFDTEVSARQWHTILVPNQWCRVAARMTPERGR